MAFLGGPLFFLSELRERFIETLNLKDDQIIAPENSQLFVAMGAALLSTKEKSTSLKNIVDKISDISNIKDDTEPRLEPLFKDKEDYNKFKERHDKNVVKRES